MLNVSDLTQTRAKHSDNTGMEVQPTDAECSLCFKWAITKGFSLEPISAGHQSFRVEGGHGLFVKLLVPTKSGCTD